MLRDIRWELSRHFVVQHFIALKFLLWLPCADGPEVMHE
jgi:hypothetical protein